MARPAYLAGSLGAKLPLVPGQDTWVMVLALLPTRVALGHSHFPSLGLSVLICERQGFKDQDAGWA